MKCRNFLILAAGSGQRMLPFTIENPKCFAIYRNTTILERLIDQIYSISPMARIFINTSHLAEKIMERILEYPLSKRPIIIYEKKPVGTAVTVKRLVESIKEDVFVIHGDLLVESKGIVDFMNKVESEYRSSISYHLRDGTKARSVLEISESNLVSEIIEGKSFFSDANLIVKVNSSVYFFRYLDLISFKPTLGYSISPSLLDYLIKSNLLLGYEWQGNRYSLETVQDIDFVNQIDFSI
jgi:NDP-sugar pyrophosphorylase family protein